MNIYHSTVLHCDIGSVEVLLVLPTSFLHPLTNFFIFFQPSTPLVALERDTYLYRSYIAQGNYRIVIQELKNADPMLLPLKTLVDYLAPQANKPTIVADIDARVSGVAFLFLALPAMIM